MSVMDRIKAEVEGHPIVLFMKGTPQFPMCGFSSRAVQALKSAGATGFHSINVLEDPEVRANLPRYSDWPTFPQLFINGELISGEPTDSPAHRRSTRWWGEVTSTVDGDSVSAPIVGDWLDAVPEMLPGV